MGKRIIEGNIHRYVCINTTEYNKDGKYCVQDCSYDELEEIGWELNVDYATYANCGIFTLIKNMCVGEMIVSDCYDGVYLMRIA